MRDVEPGEIVIVDGNGLRSIKPFTKEKRRFCVFEYIYFARPDTKVEGIGVYEARKRIGMQLATESPVEADVVVPVPDSGVPAAIGYAEQSGLPFELGIIRNHYVGRTFIEPADHIRHLGVRLKHNANRAHIEGKRVILVDNSIVRGTTSMKIVEMVRNAGAREVHMRIAAPPTTDPCFYGIDTPEREKLLASRYDVAGMAKFIGVDRLAFLSIDGLYRAMGLPGRDPANPGFCDACFTGDYPISLDDVVGVEDRQLSLLVDRPEAFLMTAASPGRWPAVWRWSPAPRAASAPRRRWPSPAKARTACWSPAPWAAWKNSTTGSRPRAARPRWCRSTSPTARASTAWAPRSTSASAASTCFWAMPASSASCRRSATSIPPCSSR